jgi:hypothetical protein
MHANIEGQKSNYEIFGGHVSNIETLRNNFPISKLVMIQIKMNQGKYKT